MVVTRIFDILERYKELYPHKDDVLAGKVNEKWEKYTAQDYINISNYLSYSLLAKGLEKGDKIGLVSNNMPEWNFVDMGVTQAGYITVPIYPTISAEEYSYILKHAEVKIIFVGNTTIYNKIKEATESIESDYEIEVFSFEEIEGVKKWDELLEEGEKSANKYKEKLEEIKSSIQEDEMATIIYTSGTTGFPKGVMLSHKNLISNAISTSKVQPFGHESRALSFLPLNHVYERMMNYHFQYKGISLYYAESMGKIADNLKEVKPVIFNSVPRLLEKVYDNIIAKGRNLPFISKMIFFWAVKLGEKYDCHRTFRPFYNFKLKFARKLIFSKWLEALGGEVKAIVSGGAALQPRLEHIFGAAGIRICEGYGLTETSPVIAVNWYFPLTNYKYGTVGKVLENVSVKIADDGEILVKGPNIMLGYYKQPELTDQVIDSEGWFHTGDIGHLDENNFLTITDRKKEIFKTSAGKYIAPQAIENKLKESFFIEQVMVIGENEKFASAIISPNFSFLHDWCSENKIQFQDNSDLIQKPEVIARFQKEVTRFNQELSEFEKIKRFRLVKDSWSPQTGELSPTLKLKRNVIVKSYHSIIEEIYFPTRDKQENNRTSNLRIGNDIKNGFIKTFRSVQETPVIKTNFKNKSERKKDREEKVTWINKRKSDKANWRNSRRTERINYRNKRRDERIEYRNKRRKDKELWEIELEEKSDNNPSIHRKVWAKEIRIKTLQFRKKRKLERLEWRKKRKTDRIEYRKSRKKAKKGWKKDRKMEKKAFRFNRKIQKEEWRLNILKQLDN